jgi:hypothetical protein
LTGNVCESGFLEVILGSEISQALHFFLKISQINLNRTSISDAKPFVLESLFCTDSGMLIHIKHFLKEISSFLTDLFPTAT